MELKRYWHGGDLDNLSSENISQKKGRYEYGVGLYLTTSHQVVANYTKGNRKLYLVTVEEGNEIEDCTLPFTAVKDFIRHYVLGKLKKEVFERISKYVKEDKVPAHIFNNIILNSKAISSTKTVKLRDFLVENGVDYNLVDNAFGWGEEMMVLYNNKKIKSIKRVTDDTRFQDSTSIVENSKHALYLKWKRKNVTYRGVKDQYSPHSHNSEMEGILGSGLYTAFLSNKSMASKYGTVLFVINAIPKNPKIFDNLNLWEIWFQNNLLKPFNYDRREFSKVTDIKTEMLKLGYDGVIIKGREMVNYTPENIIYYKDEEQVKNYFLDKVLKETISKVAKCAGVLPICTSTNRALINLRSSEVDNPNVWCNWGGMAEPNESPRQTALREFKEESGYSGSIKLIPAFNLLTIGLRFQNYIGLVEKEFIPKLTWESSDYKWVDLIELIELPNKHPGLSKLLNSSSDLILKYMNGEILIENLIKGI